MQRRIRAAGWGLLALAIVVVATVVTVGALRAHGDAAFNRWVGWATVAAVPLAAVGAVLVLWEKIASRTASAEMSIHETEDELAAVVLAEAQTTRSQLIGTDEAGDRAANMRFVKGSGRFREVGGAGQGNLATVPEYYQSLSPGRLVVLGEPGAGKTVLALELLIRLLEHRQHDKTIPIPVLVNAAAYNTRLKWEEWLATHLAARFAVSAAMAAKLVRQGRILPLVDGVDEMDPVASEAIRARVLVERLNASMRGRERSPVVVTCRRTEYQALKRGIDRATHVEMAPLTGDEAADYLQGQFLNQDEENRWEPMLAVLRDDPAGLLATQLATPWRLTLALAAFREDGDPAGLLPATSDAAGVAAQDYARRADSQLLGRYVPAMARLHDPGGRYTPQNIDRWLTFLASGLAWQARHDKSATDIQLDQWWKPTGQRVTWLTHVALIALPGLAWLFVAVVTGIPWFYLTSASVFFLAVSGRSTEPRRLRIRELTTRRGRRNLAGGLAVGLAAGLLLGLAGGLAVGLAFGLATGLAAGLAFGLVLGLAAGLDDTLPLAIGPRDVIRADGRYGLMMGLIAGLAVGLAVGLVLGLRDGLRTGLIGALTAASTYGFATGLTLVGANTWARYYISVVINAARQRGPLRFGAFLEWAQEAGLLRVSGVAYQFRHRQLQDWLTSHSRMATTIPPRQDEV